MSQALASVSNAVREVTQQPSAANAPGSSERAQPAHGTANAPAASHGRLAQDAATAAAQHIPHAASIASGPVDDPAALDTLARQLYGRFSRHLAGELLIDRERSQFLTDLG